MIDPVSRQSDLDDRIRRYYEHDFDEGARLRDRSAQGELEFRRVRTMILERISPPARVLDIGGGTGRHAQELIERGFRVTLIDLVRSHVDRARELGIAAEIGDARDLSFPDGSADAVLLMGPLYHLASREDRLRALEEARRVLVPGGLLFAAALSRFIAVGEVTLAGATILSTDQLDALIHRGEPPSSLRFPAGHYHSAEELEGELREAGFAIEPVIGVEGPAGVYFEGLGDTTPELMSAALFLAESASIVPAVRDLSAHLLGIGRA